MQGEVHKPILFWGFSESCSFLLSAPKSQRFLRSAIAMPIMLHCDFRVRWKVASDLRFRAAISGSETPSFCGISGDLAPSTRKSLAIAIVRFWCAKETFLGHQERKSSLNRKFLGGIFLGRQVSFLKGGQGQFMLCFLGSCEGWAVLLAFGSC